MSDFQVERHGSITLLVPLTEATQQWLDQNVQAEPWQWAGAALAVDPRLAQALVDAATDDSLQVDDALAHGLEVEP